MVLLHGGGADGSAWGPVVDELAVDWLVYVVDLRGHGASARTPAYSFELMRDDIAGPLQALDLRDVTLVGHSMDGIVAYLVAADLADPVTGLVMEEAPPPSPMGFPVPDHPVRGPIVSQLNEPDPTWWESLSTIACPALVVAGGQPSFLPQELLAAMAERLPRGELVTIPVGHRVHEQAPVNSSPRSARSRSAPKIALFSRHATAALRTSRNRTRKGSR